MFDHVVTREQADQRQRFEAMARSLRDLLTQRWLLTQDTYDRANPKQVYYLSMEFLIGRTLLNSIANLGVQSFVDEDLRSDPRQDWHQLLEEEPDAGLGNGGLGRLAACFLDSLATLRDSGDRLRPPLRVRHVSPGDPQRAAVRAARQLAAPSRPLGGGQDDRVGRGVAQQLGPVPGRKDPVDPAASSFTCWASPTIGRSSAMEAGRSTRCGCGRPPLPASLISVSFPRANSSPPYSTRSWRSRSPGFFIRMTRRRGAGRSGSCRSTSSSPARWPTSSAGSSIEGIRWPALPREGGHPAQRHSSVDGGRRADADPPRRGASGLGRGLEPDRWNSGLYQPHPLARGSREVAGRALRAFPAPPPRADLRDQRALPPGCSGGPSR